jgi:hypothetical protein
VTVVRINQHSTALTETPYKVQARIPGLDGVSPHQKQKMEVAIGELDAALSGPFLNR